MGYWPRQRYWPRRRFKRQHRSAETSSIQQEPPSKTSHGKQLKFDNQVVGEPAKCVSYSTPTGDANLVSPLPQYYDGSLQLVYNAFGLPAAPASISTGQILSRNLFTSTPVTKPSREKNSLNKTNTNVTITVEYHSKTVNKPESGVTMLFNIVDSCE